MSSLGGGIILQWINVQRSHGSEKQITQLGANFSFVDGRFALCLPALFWPLALLAITNPSENPMGLEGHKDEDDEEGRRALPGSLPPLRSLNSNPTTPLFCQDQEQVFRLRSRSPDSGVRPEVTASPKCDLGKYLTVSVECLGGALGREAIEHLTDDGMDGTRGSKNELTEGLSAILD